MNTGASAANAPKVFAGTATASGTAAASATAVADGAGGFFFFSLTGSPGGTAFDGSNSISSSRLMTALGTRGAENANEGDE